MCDAIMGSGKTSAAINYMCARPRDRFIYIAPFVDEDKRIAAACPDLHFVLPDDDDHKSTKGEDLKRILYAGQSVATTHALFGRCGDEIADLLRDRGYSMIIDESVETMRKTDFDGGDVEILESIGALRRGENGELIPDKDKFPKGRSRYHSSLRHAQSSQVWTTESGESFFWCLSDTMFRACDRVIIMTYLFEPSILGSYFKIMNLDYRRIYVRRTSDGQYEFCNTLCYLPEYMGRMHELLEVISNPRLNSLCKRQNELSKKWYETQLAKRKRSARTKGANGRLPKEQKDGLDLVNSRLRSFFGHYYGDTPADDRMWAVYKDFAKYVEHKGIHDAFLSFNARGFNDYGNRHTLAYMVNVYPDPNIEKLLDQHGAPISKDEYALSTMVQWIWRSAIRNGEKVRLYLPSPRMRRILFEWMDACEQEYKDLYGDQAVAPVDNYIKEDNT